MSIFTQNEPGGYQFHRLLRGIPSYRWWKPLVFGLVALVFGFTLTVGITQIALIPIIASGDLNDILLFQDRLMALDTQDPFAIAIAFLSLAVWIPAIMLAGWATGIKPLGRIWSINFRMRWKLLFRTIGFAILAFVVTQVAGALVQIPFMQDSSEGIVPAPDSEFKWSLAFISIGLAIVIVPFQAAAEELMFRGAMMQILGAWFKSPIIPILLPSLIFAFAHLYDPWALAQVGLMGVTCGWLAWRTGGLEAAISIHVVNNLAVFLILGSGLTGSTQQEQETGAGLFSLIVQIVMLAGYAWLVVRDFDKRRNLPVLVNQ